MKSLRQRSLASLTLMLLVGAPALAVEHQGGDYTITKDLIAANGAPLMASGDYTVALAWGEPVSGNQMTDSTFTLHSGYLAGGFGNGLSFYLLGSQIGRAGDRVYRQGTIQVGVALDAPVTLTFSDQLDESRITAGVRALISRDHQGQKSDAEASISTVYDRASHALMVVSSPSWSGNTLYAIALSTALTNLDGASLEQPEQVYFGTQLDPQEDNVSMDTPGPASVSAAGASLGSVVSLHLPQQSLSDYSVVLFNADPLSSPIRVDPAILLAANAKAEATGGPYRQALSIEEIVAFNARGQTIDRLAGVGELSLSYSGSPHPNLLRPQTLSIWALDEDHALWVKLPASRFAPDSRSVAVPMTQFSVFALMGEAAGSSSDSFAFPIPWRPHGAMAGDGIGQTGTESSGITFSNLPSECAIRIYTLSGDLVRTIRHSDLNGPMGQEHWDVKTSEGNPAASGVYRWVVESSQDQKNGRLMVIR